MQGELSRWGCGSFGSLAILIPAWISRHSSLTAGHSLPSTLVTGVVFLSLHFPNSLGHHLTADLMAGTRFPTILWLRLASSFSAQPTGMAVLLLLWWVHSPSTSQRHELQVQPDT
ncbi:hypothetical protein V8C44DRAFT_94177 [Trichoderma aethiopicum]